MNAKLKALLNNAVNFFDITTQCKVDLLTEGDKTVYVDPLGNKVQPLPTEAGPNLYHVHGPKGEFRQEIYFQSGSPVQGVNGLSNEAIVATVLHRISKQNETFPSPYNVLIIYLLQGALAALHARVKDRQDFGVYDTGQVEPNDKEDMNTMRNLALINSIGILGNVIFKYDTAYALNEPTKIHQMLEQLITKIKDDGEVNIASAFSFMSTALIGSGIFRAFASLGSQFIKVQQTMEMQENGELPRTEDHSTNDAS